MKKGKEHTFTFKTDEELADRLARMENRSEFIRRAVKTALGQTCPLCQGSGSLSPEQEKHWRHFLDVHSLQHCDECQAVHFVCQSDKEGDLH